MRISPAGFLLCFTFAVTGCLGSGGGDGKKGFHARATGDNHAPTIAGVPLRGVLVGESYEFTPTASDADGDSLEFAISRKPSWASFDRNTGRIWGTPGGADVDSFTNIRISVSDGDVSRALAKFDISVEQIGTGAASLSWTPPTENSDGSALSDLAGYRIYCGLNPNSPTKVIVIDNPGLTRYLVENLSRGKWYFSMTSVNSKSVESLRSATAVKSVG